MTSTQNKKEISSRAARHIVMSFSSFILVVLIVVFIGLEILSEDIKPFPAPGTRTLGNKIELGAAETSYASHTEDTSILDDNSASSALVKLSQHVSLPYFE